MEDQILKILQSSGKKFLYEDAKEITEHIMEFIEWLTINTMRATTYSPMFYLLKFPEHHADTSKELHIKEVYEYWLNNVNKK
jgi:hypothetical protein